MLESYEPFCLADPVFFDTPDRLDDRDTRFAAADRPAPPGWSRTERDSWVVLLPTDRPLPEQGWKVHVSVTLDAADKTVDAVVEFCLRHRVAVKFLRSRAASHAAGFKYAPRGGSGKLMAVYPSDEDELRHVLTGLDDLVGGTPGPRVLSDLRWREGPLYVRYGAFTERFCPGPDGEPVRAVTGPDGRPVPDDRSPVFRVPSWVTVPRVVADEMDRTRTAAGSSEQLPYTVERALHFSNAGGVYLATDPLTGRRVVLKEARPHAGLDRNEDDAVTRLVREWTALRTLSGLGVAPRAFGHLVRGGHHFLVQEFLDGTPLHRERAVRHPLSYPDPTDAQIAEYTDWALDVLRQVEVALETVHGRGLAYRDLHPANVLVRPEGGVRLLDFELATDLDDRRPAGLGVPGFTTPAPLTAAEADRYALGCLRLSMFLPMTELLQGERVMAARMAVEVTRRFPVPPSYAGQVLDELRPGLPARVPPGRRSVPESKGAESKGSKPEGSPEPAGSEPAAIAYDGESWPHLRDRIAEGILSAATPERDDRLYPGDPQQFRIGGHGLAYGTAGVLYALAATGSAVPDAHVDWLVSAAERARPTRVGLMDGLTGVAFALHRIGRPAAVRELLARILDAPTPQGNSLFSGRAGIGLGLLHLAGARGCRPDPALLERAMTLAQEIVDDLDRTPPEAAPVTATPGLLRGWSGPALLLTRLYAATREPALLDAAERALARDLAHCETRPGGAVHLSDGVRVQPFLGDGSAGVGLALHALSAYRDTDHHAELRDGIAAACRAELVYETGLFHGRAGLLAYRAATGDSAERLAAGARSLLRYAATRDGFPAFPGRLLLRRSTDLATGAAGVLLALHGALSGEQAVLPLPGCGPFVRKAVGDPADRPLHNTRMISQGGERNVDPRPSGAGVRGGR